jgi:hypothetical protein
MRKAMPTFLVLLAWTLHFCSGPTPEDDSTRQSKFYVATGGDDMNPGTHERPWNTLSRVNQHQSMAGDSIFFARGSSFAGGLLITDSGNEVNPIVLAAYGEGSAPRFTNPQLSTLNGNMIQIRGSYIVVDGLCFHNGVGTTQEQEVDAREIAAVYLTLGADHNIIKNCEMVDCPVGVQSYGQYNLITHNYIHDCNRFLSEPNWGPIGIMVATSNHEISYNRIINYARTGGTFGADGGAIEIDNEDYPNNNIYIHHNWSVGNEGFLEIIWGADITRDVRVSYNVSDDYQEFIFFWSGKDCFVENNTVLCTRPPNSRVRVVFSFNEGNNLIRNNIFVVANGIQVFTGTDVYGAERYDEQIFHHNLYWCIDGSVEDPCGQPLGEGDIVADPRFVDLENLDLHLREDSPAIDVGVALGYSIDFEGETVPYGGRPDMGAYEYQP